MHQESERFPVNQLMQRYQIVKSGVYNRMRGLGIHPFRVAGKAYLTLEQLQLLDELHQFIQSKGTLAQFLERKRLQHPNAISSAKSNGCNASSSSIPVLLFFSIEPDSMEYFERLERAAQKRWHLSSTEVAVLLKLPVDQIEQQSDRFCEAGFLFTRVGERLLGEAAWRVSKLDPH
ncbi:hypothetical protein IFO70_27685 [Phormidium tenue FACHB-886]|nr:hypothetical protein [Phormidium tenue FACHB-886]